jgi:toxin CcdB
VVPLAALDERSAPPITGLMPVFEIEGSPVVMHTAEMAGIARKALGPQVSSLAGHRNEIVAALDVVISGV